jgi:hypothetical protein
MAIEDWRGKENIPKTTTLQPRNQDLRIAIIAEPLDDLISVLEAGVAG